MNPQLLLLFLSLLPFTTHALQPPVVKREISATDVFRFHGAVLLKNGKQTSCELALMHSKAAFVPASCFDISSSNSAADVSPYQIAFDAGGFDVDRKVVSVDKVVINPHYNPTTFANNVAVILFNSQLKLTWSNYIDRYPEQVTDRVFARRSMKNEDKQTWNAPAVANDVTNDDGCKKASVLFASNPADLLCSSKSMPSLVGSSCHVPYGVIYGRAQSETMVTAMYSHSAVYGSDMCGDSKAYHHYTILSNYINWATGIVSSGIYVYPLNGAFSASNDLNYTMKNSAVPSPSGVSLISSDIYARNADVDLKVTSSSSSPYAAATFSDDTSSTSSDNSTDSKASSKYDLPMPASSPVASPSTDTGSHTTGSNPSTNFSKPQIVGMAIGISVAISIITVALLFLYKRWQRHKKIISWDPANEADAINAIALELGQPNVTRERPPTSANTSGESLSIFNFIRRT